MPQAYTDTGMPTSITLGEWETYPDRGDYPAMPDDWQGTEPEWAINWALTTLGATFVYQKGILGGRSYAGGIVADFLVEEPSQLIIQIQGTHWHYELGHRIMINDALQRAVIEAEGTEVINIDEEDAMSSPLFYTKEALLGIDHSRAKKMGYS